MTEIVTAVLLITFFILAPTSASAQREKVMHSFNSNGVDGFNVYASLVKDKVGDLYGTTSAGGAFNCGTVFEITRKGAETVVYSFGGQPGDGCYPYAKLARDKAGNLYGTTYWGGAHNMGTVFQVSPTGAETVLYSFGSQPGDGTNPVAGVTFDKAGNLYGTTFAGGTNNWGTVFRLTSAGDETQLYTFPSLEVPDALVLGRKDILYGFTHQGGAGWGTVFSMTTTGTMNEIYSFYGPGYDGADPEALILDKAGNLYGTTYWGGNGGCYSYGCGTVFAITSPYHETVLHTFALDGVDGTYPGGLVLDAKGNLLGVTLDGGSYNSGTIFRLTPSGTETILHNFSNTPDGAFPYPGMIFDAGALYSTTASGGAYGYGTVFKLVP